MELTVNGGNVAKCVRFDVCLIFLTTLMLFTSLWLAG